MSSSYDSYDKSRFETFDINFSTKDPSGSVTIHGVKSISNGPIQAGPPVLLLHGHPQTHHIWHKVAPILLDQGFKVVIPDLRGHGHSSKPAPDDDTGHETYSKRAFANDQVAIMKELGHEQFFVVGHDRGGRVAHRLALDHPDKVIKVIVLDIAPTLAMYDQAGKEFATAYWHWFFLIQPAPMPESFIAASPEAYLSRGQLLKTSSVFSSAAIASYLENFRDSASIHAMCEDYRASAPGGFDLTLDAQDIEEQREVKAPLKVLWGVRGVIEKLFDAKKEWSLVCEKQVVGRSVPTGHYIPEGKLAIFVARTLIHLREPTRAYLTEMDSNELAHEISSFFSEK